MATLVFSAVGTAIGGPLAGAVGALAGRQIDNLITPQRRQHGPRITELAITTSSYGTPIARHFGRIRVGGTVIWATDLVEHESHQGGKGQVATTTYGYTVSLAVALASRPIKSVGRIWADGKLLRGSAGDLKVAGILRLHCGHPDQAPDPLIASAEGARRCPAYRGLAYVVFEDLNLGEFGNRIPALTFEVVADTGQLSGSHILESLTTQVTSSAQLTDCTGITLEGPPADLLEQLDQVIPMSCVAREGKIEIGPDGSLPVLVGAAATTIEPTGFGRKRGESTRYRPQAERPVGLLRYYDQDRDFQPGVQRAFGNGVVGEVASIDLPVAMAADRARGLIVQHTARHAWARQGMVRRLADLDPAVMPGRLARLPDQPGLWKIAAWEWSAAGVEIELMRIVETPPQPLAASAGRITSQIDQPTGASVIRAFELPPETVALAALDSPIWIAAASAADGWRGGTVYAESAGGNLVALNQSVARKAVMGRALTVLPPHSPHLLDRSSTIVVELIHADMELVQISTRQLLQGANLALIGRELVQFSQAKQIGAKTWCLSILARGRGGMEGAVFDHAPDEPFTLLNERLVPVSRAQTSTAPIERLAIIGLGDANPAYTPIMLNGQAVAPLTPVHGRVMLGPGAEHTICWTRRARGAWAWPDQVEVPLGEESENWRITFVNGGAELASWTTTQPRLTINQAQWGGLVALAPLGHFAIRQVGTRSLSEPLLIAPVPTRSIPSN